MNVEQAEVIAKLSQGIYREVRDQLVEGTEGEEGDFLVDAQLPDSILDLATEVAKAVIVAFLQGRHKIGLE